MCGNKSVDDKETAKLLSIKKALMKLQKENGWDGLYLLGFCFRTSGKGELEIHLEALVILSVA